MRRVVSASSREGDWVLDFFAGSGTLGAVAAELNRKFVCVDQNPQAIEVMGKRLGAYADIAAAPAPRAKPTASADVGIVPSAGGGRPN